jgi:ribosome-binding factor A
MARTDNTRVMKVRKALIREVSDIIPNVIKDPRLTPHLISVTDIDVSHDLQHAKIYVSIMADEDKQNELLAILKEAQPKIRLAVGQRIRLRHTPSIEVFLDDSLERGSRISQLLEQIAKEEL